MVQLIELPLETLLSIFREVDPEDLAVLCQCCRLFQAAISHNYLLYRNVYLSRWDAPQNMPFEVGKHWEQATQKFTKMLKILSSSSIDIKKSEILFVASAIDEFLAAGSLEERDESLNVSALTKQFRRKENRNAFLYRSSTFARARSFLKQDREPSASSYKSATDALSAKIHCLFGTSNDRTYRIEGLNPYPFAASRVYDLRNYTDANLWGPFKNDASQEVDWEKMEAVMIVMGHNIEQRRILIDGPEWDLWTRPFRGSFAHSYRPRKSLLTNVIVPSRVSKKVVGPLQWSSEAESASSSPALDDPYGVSGYWMRIVCFVDYSELFAYNFHPDAPPADEPRMPLDTEEETRIIIMHLEATSIEAPGEDDGPDMPVVHFRGISRAILDFWDPNAHAHIRGSVRTTKEGEVRWTTYSSYHGQEKWKSEGIQIGGVRSARGVFGNWFDRNYDPHGPAGPTAFWKIGHASALDGADSD